MPNIPKNKTTNQKYGKLTPKQAETNHWEMLCVDLIGPYMIPQKGKNCLNYGALQWLILPQPGLRWHKYPIKRLQKLQISPKKTWFTRYPLPQQIVFDRGTKFMAEFSKICQNEYGLKRKPITTRNPQSNAIVEQIHQTIGNFIRTFDVSNIVNNNLWSCILAATMFAVCANYHTTLQASLMKLVFGWDSILNLKRVANW